MSEYIPNNFVLIDIEGNPMLIIGVRIESDGYNYHLLAMLANAKEIVIGHSNPNIGILEKIRDYITEHLKSTSKEGRVIDLRKHFCIKDFPSDTEIFRK